MSEDYGKVMSTARIGGNMSIARLEHLRELGKGLCGWSTMFVCCCNICFTFMLEYLALYMLKLCTLQPVVEIVGLFPFGTLRFLSPLTGSTVQFVW